MRRLLLNGEHARPAYATKGGSVTLALPRRDDWWPCGSAFTSNRFRLPNYRRRFAGFHGSLLCLRRFLVRTLTQLAFVPGRLLPVCHCRV